MTSKKMIIIANLLLTALIGLIIGLFYNFTSTLTIVVLVLLLLTLLTPSIYMCCTSLIYKDAKLSNLLAPTIIATSIFMLVNLVTCVIMLCIGSNLSVKGLIITELIIIVLYSVIMLVIASLTKYIRNVNNMNR